MGTKRDKIVGWVVILYILFFFILAAVFMVSDMTGRTAQGYLKSESIRKRVFAGCLRCDMSISWAYDDYGVCPLFTISLITWESVWDEGAQSNAGAKGLGQVLGGNHLFCGATNIEAMGKIISRLARLNQDTLTPKCYQHRQIYNISGAYYRGRAGLRRLLGAGKGHPDYCQQVFELHSAFRDEVRRNVTYGFVSRFLTQRIIDKMKEIYGITYIYSWNTYSQTVCKIWDGKK